MKNFINIMANSKTKTLWFEGHTNVKSHKLKYQYNNFSIKGPSVHIVYFY
jgi:hypothetical protein